jgi:ABC-type transport system involved in multi-copper enzyme maturation permease subunit
MYSLRSVDVWSCAKIMGAIYGCLGLIFLPFLLWGGIGSLLFGRDSASFPGVAMLFLAILAPIFYGVMGFVMGAFTAWVYNLVAKRIGGIRLELKVEFSSSPSAMSPL